MFVIIQNWDNIGGPTNKERSIPENIALAMRSAVCCILLLEYIVQGYLTIHRTVIFNP